VKNFAYSGRWLAKLHAYAFYVLRSAFKTAWNDAWEEWKALLVISVATVSAGLTIASIISICLQRRVLLPQSKAEFVTLWGVVGLSLVILNYYTLVFGRKWSRFEEEFRMPLEDETRREIGGVAVWVSRVLIIADAEWTGSIAWKLPPFG
jgi:branched-subunit amino acid ABC-type transport system permease component